MESISVGFWCLLPPLIAIGLALITKEVIFSLVLGILSGSLIYAFNTDGGVAKAVSNMFAVMGDNFDASMIIFLCLLGALVAVVTMAGGSRAYGNWAAAKVKSPRAAQTATSALGALIFIDDYFNCLTVGTVMRPVTDKFQVSREKLAYIIDSAAAPVCIIAPISSWAASVISNLPANGEMSGMEMFVSTIPFNLYALLTITMLLCLSLFNLDFGPMEKYQHEAKVNGQAEIKNQVDVDELAGVETSPRGKVFDLVIPILALIVFSVLGMLYTGGLFDGSAGNLFEAFGNTNANLSLAMGGFSALIVAAVLFIPRKLMSFKKFMSGITVGVKSMVSACMILTLAWALKGICAELSVADYVAEVVGNSNLPAAMLPAIIFVVASFLSFSTGTAWGTFGILIPIVVPLCEAMDPGLLIITLSATLGGSVFGDHCSPISDTTILSSTGAGCDHIRHVSSQIPYAVTVAVCSGAGYLVAGFTENLWLTLATAFLLLAMAILLMHRNALRKEAAGKAK